MPMKKSRTQDTAADFARRSNATSRMGRPPSTTRMAPEDVVGTSSLAPMSTRDKPVQRPANLADRMEAQRLSDRMAMTARQDPGMTLEQMERGSSAPARSMRPTARPQRFEEGGKVNGFPDLNDDGKVTKADILKGRGVEGFKAGGMVTGSRAQISGTKFSGTF